MVDAEVVETVATGGAVVVAEVYETVLQIVATGDAVVDAWLQRFTRLSCR